MGNLQRSFKTIFLAYGIEDEGRKAALLLTAVSTDIFRTLNNVCFPAKPEQKTFNQLCELLQK